MKIIKKIILSAMSLLILPAPCSLASDAVSGYAVSTPIYQLENYPLRMQYNNDCWAVTIASMVQYINGTGCPVERVYSRYVALTGNEFDVNAGAYPDECFSVIKDMIPSGYWSESYDKLPQSIIRMAISHGKPAFMAGHCTNRDCIGEGHAVAMMGYRDAVFAENDRRMIAVYFMNPQNGQIRSCNYNEDQIVQFPNDQYNHYYKWDYSVVTPF